MNISEVSWSSNDSMFSSSVRQALHILGAFKFPMSIIVDLVVFKCYYNKPFSQMFSDITLKSLNVKLLTFKQT